MRVFRSIIIVLCFTACGKSTQVEGTVFSKHNNPIENANLTLLVYRTASSYPQSFIDKGKTDNTGHFIFNFKYNTINKNYRYAVICKSDSGSTDSNGYKINNERTNHINIYLN
jgi:hypothetical protein